MKRAYLRKVKPNVSSPSSIDSSVDEPVSQSEQGLRGVRRRARTSAAMVGLALSMGATGLVLPRQSDGAAAAESAGTGATISPVPQAVPTVHEESNSGTAVATAASTEVQHTVAAGETLHGIARKYQVTVTAIAKANKLSTRSILQVGQVLKVPTRANLQSLAESSAASVLSQASEKSAASSLQVDREQALSRLRLQREQLQSKLSELRPESAQDLSVEPSGELLGHESSKERHALIAELPPTELAPTAESAVQVDSVVQSQSLQEDVKQAASVPTIPQIDFAEAPQTSSGRLLQPDWMRSNQNLLTPNQSESEPSANLLALRPAASVPLSQPMIPQVAPESIAYRVGPGDTVAEIAETYNVSQSLLISANRISDPNFIFVGQVLQVPGGQPFNASAAGSSSIESKALPVAETQISARTEPLIVPTQASPTQTANDAQSVNPVTLPTVASPEYSVASSILPRQVAVAPLSNSPATSTAASELTLPTAPNVPGAAESAAEANPFVQNLLTEIRTLRQQYQPGSEPAQPQAVQPAAPAESTTIAAASLSGSMAVNPQLQRRNNRAVEASVPAAMTNQPQTVAAAPLGSESYQPLLRPVTGRMVSPDLPPLPGADNFLPNQREVFAGYIWPARGMLTSGYGWRWGRMHQGIDIAADVGTPIHSAANGVVQFAGWNAGGYGNMIEIRHADGSMTRYAHLNRILVRVGQEVSQSQQIGEMGSTGYSTGPHLHFEVHLASQGTVNPISYLPRR